MTTSVMLVTVEMEESAPRRCSGDMVERARLSLRISSDTSRMICCDTRCERRGLAIATAPSAPAGVCQRGGALVRAQVTCESKAQGRQRMRQPPAHRHAARARRVGGGRGRRQRRRRTRRRAAAARRRQACGALRRRCTAARRAGTRGAQHRGQQAARRRQRPQRARRALPTCAAFRKAAAALPPARFPRPNARAPQLHSAQESRSLLHTPHARRLASGGGGGECRF